ncbi:MAG: FAD-dependent oxidoreductase, partial [Myxococcota bacterium]
AVGARIVLYPLVVVRALGAHLPYDDLVVAVGARNNFFGNTHWAKHATGLKDVRDALSIRERILLSFEAAERSNDPDERQRLTTFVVIGGGPTGVEMAGAISELGRQVLADDYPNVPADSVRVVLVEMAKRVLTSFDEDLSYEAERQLEELGVELRLGQPVTDIQDGYVMLGDERLDVSVVVWASGVKAEAIAAESAMPQDWNGRLMVDGHCCVKGHPSVFAIGDAAHFVPEGEEEPLPGLGAVAMQQGIFLAKQLRRRAARKPLETFKYKDRGTMATVGRSRAVVQGGIKMTGFFAWIAWCLVHVILLMGFRNRAVVLFNWVWAYVTYKRGARLITGQVPIRTTDQALAEKADEAPGQLRESA